MTPLAPGRAPGAAKRRRKRVKAAKFQSQRAAANRRQIAEINRHLDEIGDRVFGPTSSGPWTPAKAKAQGKRQRERPGAELRTAAGREFYQRNAPPQSFGESFMNVARTYGNLGEAGLDFMTGIPTFARDPSLGNAGWVAASLFPAGKAARIAKAGASAGRMIGSDIYRTAIRPTKSMIMRPVEQAGSTVMGKVAPGHAAKQAAWETSRTLKTRQEVTTAAGRALSKLSRKLSSAEHVAMLVVAEGRTKAERVAAHRGWIDELKPIANDADITARERAVARASIKFHEQHIRLLRDAERFLENTPTGPVISRSASPTLKKAWEVLEKSEETRTQIIRDLAVLTDDKISARIQKPGRIIGGARWQEATGKIPAGLAGEEAFQAGKRFVPSQPGVPGVRYGSKSAPIRLTVAWMSGGSRRVMSGLRRDPSLQREMTGQLIRSGMNRTDAGNLTAEAMMKAWRLMKTRDMRDVFLANGLSYENAVRYAAQKGKKVEDMFIPVRDTRRVLHQDVVDPKTGRVIESARSPITPKEHDMLEMSSLTEDALEGMSDKTISAVQNRLLPEIEEAIAESLAGKGVKWVPREIVWGLSDDMTRWHLENVAKHPAARAVKEAWAAVNDLMRFGILYMPPTTLAYITANLLGNGFLMMVDQAPWGAVRSVLDAFPGRKSSLFGKLPLEHQVAIDVSAGAGSTLAIGTFGNTAVKRAIGGYTNLVHAATDLVPRRAAMLHHLRKAGYDTPEKIGKLIDDVKAGDRQALSKFDAIKREANDAMIDFDRLGPLEKGVTTQLLFLYPWLKGATRYTARFPIEHPVSAPVVGYGLYRQQQENENLGPGPWYEEPLIGLPQSVVDWIPWADPEKQYVFNVGSLVPFFQPWELAESLRGTFTGDTSLPSVFGTLSPTIQNLLGVLTGYDPEMDRKIEGNIFERAATVFSDDIRPVRMARQLIEPEEERVENLYPRSNADIIASAIFGSATPKPRNPETAAELVAEPADIRAKNRQELVADAMKAGAPANVVREYNRMLLRRQQLDDQIDREATPKDKAMAAFTMAKRVFPNERSEIEAAIRELTALNSDVAWQRAYERARGVLFSDYISNIESTVRGTP